VLRAGLEVSYVVCLGWVSHVLCYFPHSAGGSYHSLLCYEGNTGCAGRVSIFLYLLWQVVYYVYYMISAFVLKGLRTMPTTCLDGPEIKLSQRDVSRTSTPQPKIRTTGGVTAQTEKDTKKKMRK